jgi:hypothetical protein
MKICDASGSWLGFHRGEFGFNVTYRRGEPFQCVLKACEYNLKSLCQTNTAPERRHWLPVGLTCEFFLSESVTKKERRSLDVSAEA